MAVNLKEKALLIAHQDHSGKRESEEEEMAKNLSNIQFQ